MAFQDLYFTYRENIFNRYIGERVRVTIRNRRMRQKVFVGTFKGYDFHVNIVLADAYRVILNCTEEQKQNVDGLLLLRGVNVRSVTYEDERRMPHWPTRPKKVQKSTEKGPTQSQHDKPKAPPTPTKPVKLKRSWLTSPGPSGYQQQSPQTQVATGKSSSTTHKEVKTPSTPEKGSGETPIALSKVVKQEAGVMEENRKSTSTTFEDFLLANFDYEDLESVTIKSEVEESSDSDNYLSP